ncbi:hypothetical protein PROFUN_11628, partial [Planoprotostelium fungivorum]
MWQRAVRLGSFEAQRHLANCVPARIVKCIVANDNRFEDKRGMIYGTEIENTCASLRLSSTGQLLLVIVSEDLSQTSNHLEDWRTFSCETSWRE